MNHTSSATRKTFVPARSTSAQLVERIEGRPQLRSGPGVGKQWLLLLFLLGVLAACQPLTAAPKPTASFPAEVASSWFDLQLTLIKETPGFTPPVAARALGYSAITLYEAVLPGMPAHNSLAGQVNGLETLPLPEDNEATHWPAAANSALATILRRLYPTAAPENLAAIDMLEQQFGAKYKTEAGPELFDRSVAYGQAVATSIFEWSTSDGGHEGYSTNFPNGFMPSAGPGLWVPTPPKYQTALQPYWGENRPFVLQSGEECAPPPPTAYSSDPDSQFYIESMEVYETVKNLTAEQRDISQFWADDPGSTFTPPGHSIAIATQVLRQQEADLGMATATYARVGIAVSDAFVGCWHVKYAYNLIRPISYIQANIERGWNNPEITDPVITPPFPEYPSGHSVQSGATAAVLTQLFEDNYRFTDNSHWERGLPARRFGSFFEAADEAAISRLYGGIHYRPAIEYGVAQGLCIGEKVNALAWLKAGSSDPNVQS